MLHIKKITVVTSKNRTGIGDVIKANFTLISGVLIFYKNSFLCKCNSTSTLKTSTLHARISPLIPLCNLPDPVKGGSGTIFFDHPC